ncbi:Rpn family recombination-promoting nuclease/putative transposase [Candidatus Babeliales bacterium]|nr:Rpn family recombination-promoting nuclease/putative transposase [Candidatus Babeliales bacterium]
MFFLDPMIDIAFKKLFGDQAKQEIVISFLNSVLGCKEGEKIVKVVITDPYNTPDTKWLKTSIVDVRCVDQSGKHYVIELQVESQDDYPERSQYYAALAMARQLKIGGEYESVMPVIFIGVLDFNIFEDAEYLTHHKILNTKTHTHSLRHLEFHFIELRKFNKTLEDLDNLVDKWIYLLKNASTLNTIPKQFKSTVALKEAMEVLEEGNMSPEELSAYDHFIDARRVAKSIKKTQIRHGMRQGIKKTQRSIALNLLSQLSIDHVARATGLSVDEVKKISASLDSVKKKKNKKTSR